MSFRALPETDRSGTVCGTRILLEVQEPMNQHRRDLNTNELEKLAGKMAPFFEKYGNQLLYGAAAAILAFGVIFYFVTSSQSAEKEAWEAFNAARTAADFGKVAESYRDKPVADWARLNEAEQYVDQGVQGMFKDREGAVSDLETAQEHFETLVNKSGLPEIVEMRAQLGLARCVESLSDGDTSQAVDAYKKFLEKFPDTAYDAFAKERIKVLESDAGKEFYAWFSQQNPTPDDIKRPLDGSSGLPGGHPPVDPGDFVFLPEIPDILQLPDDVSGAAPEFPDDAGGPSPPPLPEDSEGAGKAPAFPDGDSN